MSCGVDRNIKMWDVHLDAPLDSSEAGPSQARPLPLHLSRCFADIFTATTTRGFSWERDAPVSPRTYFVSHLLITNLV